MESDGVSLPLIHEHSMVPWNHLGKGDCCGGFEAITDGFYCELCKFFVHKKCSESSEYIQHPSHSGHTLQFQRPQQFESFYSGNTLHDCNLCGRRISYLFYRCEICDFNIDLYCLKYPPPEVIHVSEPHQHKLTLLKERIYFHCNAKNCGKTGKNEFAYKCHEFDLTFHVDCVWHPLKHPLEYKTIDAGERVSLPWIHNHFMLPCNDMKKGACCARFESITDGYYCKRCNVFVHKKCSNTTSESIQHPSHSLHPLWFQSAPRNSNACDICGKRIGDLFYRCEICDFDMDLHCGTYPPPEVIKVTEMHHHKLTLLKERFNFDCDAKCGKTGEDEFAYKCHECDLNFHVDCVWHPSEAKHTLEVNHSYHPLHPLKLYIGGQLPDYSDGKCRLCGNEIDQRLFYHCSLCNFSLDMRCVLNPPPRSLLHLKAHDHQLTLLPRLDSFTCNACGLKGDQSPYICVQCGFMIHQDCLNLPHVININRHDHRISHTSLLGVVNSVCGVCHKKVDWTYGGYSCQRCPNYIVHSKCATRKDVWNGKELEGVPEEIEDIEPYVVIDDNTIQHFSHKEHNLRLDVNGVLFEERKRCRACCHPIGFQSFYGCLDCDFILHQNCAQLPKKRWHPLHNDRLTLVTSKVDFFKCDVCYGLSSGFFYQHLRKKIDVRCISISEPFLHPSHPDHPLYYMSGGGNYICNGCKNMVWDMHTCIEDGCEFVLCFHCAILPKVVKHRVDDHPLLLCYGGKKESGKCWCDICEEESDPRKLWFYTCKDHRACLHTQCVLGNDPGLMPRSTIEERGKPVEVVLNNSVSRPICRECDSRCMYPIIFKLIGTSDTYFCDYGCYLRFLLKDKVPENYPVYIRP